MKIYVVGYPRSGDVWLAHMLGEALGIPTYRKYDEPPRNNQSYVVYQRKFKLMPKNGKKKVVFVYRDPRDVIVSLARYWKGGNVNAILNTNDKSCVLFGWPAMMERWINQLIPHDAVCYEAVRMQTLNELDRTLMHIGEDVRDDKMNRAIATQKKNVMPIGDYKTILSREQGRKIHEYMWPWLKRLDYETNDRWYEELWKLQPELL